MRIRVGTPDDVEVEDRRDVRADRIGDTVYGEVLRQGCVSASMKARVVKIHFIPPALARPVHCFDPETGQSRLQAQDVLGTDTDARSVIESKGDVATEKCDYATQLDGSLLPRQVRVLVCGS